MLFIQSDRHAAPRTGASLKSALAASVSLAILAFAAPALAQQADAVPGISVIAPGASSPTSDSGQNLAGASGSGQPKDGSAAAGYLVKDTSATGPFWGDLPLQDAPYSIHVVSSALIDNTQAYTIQDALKYVPGVQIGNNTQFGATGTSSWVIRGYYGGNGGYAGSGGMMIDGLTGQGEYFYPFMEDKENLQVLSGVSGFLYGVGQVGGVVNEVLKRPTAAPMATVELGDNAGANFYVHGDFGGPMHIPGITDGMFAYRLNLTEQTGGTSIRGQSIDRNQESLALDFKPLDNLLFQFNAAHTFAQMNGETPYFINSTGLPQYPSPASASSITAPSWLSENDSTATAGVGMTWKINDIFTLRSRYNYMDETYSPFELDYAYITSATGTTSVHLLAGGKGGAYITNSGYTFLDAQFDLFGISNKLTFGFNGSNTVSQQGQTTNTPPLAAIPANFYNFSATNWGLGSAGYAFTGAHGLTIGKNYGENYMIGDEIKYGNLTILAGGNYALVGSKSYNQTSGVLSGEYQSAALTPTVLVSYKIYPNVTAYASYQQSLTPGQIVPATNGNYAYTNAGAILPPYMGTQYEVGVKATIFNNLLATFAAFDINRANIYTLTNGSGTNISYTMLEGGSVHNRGIELSVAGKATEDLSLFGGVTLMDARVQSNPSSPWQNGQLEQDASPFLARLYGEYRLPNVVQGADWLRNFTLTAGVTYNGPFNGSIRSSYTTVAPSFPGYALVNLGFRYATKIWDHPATLRFNVNNVADTSVWTAPGDISIPRTYLATAEFKW